jgi:integrase/recombinase XerC
MRAGASAATSADPRRELVAAYLDHLAFERRLAEATRVAYAHGLDALLAAVPDIGPADMRTHHVRRAVAQLRSRGLDGRTIARVLSSWRGYFRWLARHHGLAADPCAGVRAPRVGRALPKALTPDEARQLLDRTADGALERRDKAMFELCLVRTRLAELVGLARPIALDLRDNSHREQAANRQCRSAPSAPRCEWVAARRVPGRPSRRCSSARAGTREPAVVRLPLVLRAGSDRVHPPSASSFFSRAAVLGDLRAVQEMLGTV